MAKSAREQWDDDTEDIHVRSLLRDDDEAFPKTTAQRDRMNKKYGGLFHKGKKTGGASAGGADSSAVPYRQADDDDHVRKVVW